MTRSDEIISFLTTEFSEFYTENTEQELYPTLSTLVTLGTLVTFLLTSDFGLRTDFNFL